MAGPWPLDEFSELVRLPTGDVERYHKAGLLDPESDGRFTSQDVLRIQVARQAEEERGSLDGLRDELASSDDPIFRSLFLPKVSLERAAEAAGMTSETVQGFRTAFGFSMQNLDEEDIKATQLPRLLAEAGLPPEAIFEGARVYGDALQKIADAGLQITHRYLCEPLARAGTDPAEMVRQFSLVWKSLTTASLETLQHLYIDFLVDAVAEHAVSHLQGDDPDAPSGSLEATIVFADLALFSSLAELEGDEAAVGLVDRVDRLIRELRSRHAGKLVKQIGDEFMLSFSDPADAVRFSCELQRELSRTERDVAARIGMHQGRILYRLGDYYGHAVNLASRIASMAMPNSILVTERPAEAARELGIEVNEIGVRTLRGMDEAVGLYRIYAA